MTDEVTPAAVALRDAVHRRLEDAVALGLPRELAAAVILGVAVANLTSAVGPEIASTMVLRSVGLAERGGRSKH